MRRIRQFRKGFIVWLAVLSLFFFLNSSLLEARSCERALVKCLDDAFVMTSFAGGFYCGLGYVFCKKYIM